MASSIANTLLTVKIIINTTPDIVYSCMHMYPYRGVKKCGREGIPASPRLTAVETVSCLPELPPSAPPTGSGPSTSVPVALNVDQGDQLT